VVEAEALSVLVELAALGVAEKAATMSLVLLEL
jgi:hypothetical protein